MFNESLECKICGSEMKTETTIMNDLRVVCSNGCYEEITSKSHRRLIYIFGERIFIDLNDVDSALQQIKNVNEKIDYWKQGERYLIKILEGYVLENHTMPKIHEQYGVAMINSKAIARIRLD